MLRAVALCALALGPAACFQSDVVTCSDGTLCPPQSQCDLDTHSCLSPEQLAACSTLQAGDPCTLAGAPGTCTQKGACVVAFCGDGVRNGSEPCEGDDLGGLTCNSFGYTSTSGLKCTAACTFET